MRVLTVIEQFEHSGVAYLKGQVIRMEHLVEELVGLGHHVQHFVVASHADVAPEPAPTPVPAADDKSVKVSK